RRCHGIDGVQNQVQHDLLHMDLVAVHDRQRGELGVHRDAVPAQVRGDEVQDVGERAVQIEGRHGGLAPAREGAHVTYDLARPHVVVTYVVDDLAQFLDRHRVLGEQYFRGIRVAQYRAEGLVDLVRDGGGKLSHHRQPRYVREVPVGFLDA